MVNDVILVGGFKHVLCFIIYGMSSFPLINIFQDGFCTTDQDLQIMWFSHWFRMKRHGDG
jgi:hypothetical protein